MDLVLTMGDGLSEAVAGERPVLPVWQLSLCGWSEISMRK